MLSAHDLLISRDCTTPGCPREAGRNSAQCDDCIRNPPRPRIDDAELFGAFDDDEPHERSTPMSAVATAICKREGCPEQSEDMQGPYARLCSTHKQEARASRQSGGISGGGSHQPRTITDGYVTRVRSLLAPAKSLDQAKRKLAETGSNETLRAALQEASRNATASPTAANLERLETASKALRRSAPQRDKATTAFNDAERKFKLALAEIARDFRVA